MGLFVVQLILNAAWSWVFFGLRQTGWAMVEVALLWGTIVGATVALFQVSIPAGLLFVPYMAWVSFASVLNFAIWRLNRGST